MVALAHVDDDFEWIIYVRISDDREGAGLGVERQTEDGRTLAARLGGRVLTTCSDNDMTANDRSDRYKPRPEYDRLCALLRARPGHRGVIAWHTDRLHRTPRELEDFIDLIEATGADVQTVKSGQLDLSTASGRMTARVHCAVARHESEHKSERIRRKVEELAAAGSIYGGGPRPYGYTRIYSGEGPRRKILRDEINPAEAEIIRECARRLLAGDRLRTVVRWLNDSGHTSSTGKPWSLQALRHMMRSGRIAGLREHRREVVGRAVWEGIISVDDHKLLRTMLDSHERAPGSKVRTHYLSGFIYCSSCAPKNVKMRVGRQHGKLKYKCPPDDGCNGRVIPLEDLRDMVDAYMVARLADPKTLRELAEREATDDGRAAVLLDEIEAGERRLNMLAAQMEDGDEDDIPEVVAAVRTIRRRLGKARAELAEVTARPEVESLDLADLAARWLDLEIDTKQKLMRLFVERIVIGPARRGLARFDPDRVDIVPVGQT